MRPNRPLRAKPQRDWRLTVVLGLTAVVVAMLAIGTPAVISASNTTKQIQRGSDISACRSIANSAVTDARTVLDEKGVASDVFLNRFVEAVLNRDTTTLAQLRAQVPTIRDDLEHAAAQLREKTDLYNAAVRLSSSNPAEFLRQCEETQ